MNHNIPKRRSTENKAYIFKLFETPLAVPFSWSQSHNPALVSQTWDYSHAHCAQLDQTFLKLLFQCSVLSFPLAVWEVSMIFICLIPLVMKNIFYGEALRNFIM